MLFDCSGYCVVLIDDGEVLLFVVVWVFEFVVVLQELVVWDEGLSGWLCFGVGELLVLMWLLCFVVVVQKLYLKLVFELYVDVGVVLEEKVDVGELDFVVIVGCLLCGSVMLQLVVEVWFVWMVVEMLVGSECDLMLVLIVCYVLVLLLFGLGVMCIFDDWLLVCGINYVCWIVCNNWSVVVGMLSEGVGIGFLLVDWVCVCLGGDFVELMSELLLMLFQYVFQWCCGDVCGLILLMLLLVWQYVDFC